MGDVDLASETIQLAERGPTGPAMVKGATEKGESTKGVDRPCLRSLDVLTVAQVQ